jgi:hypothetical protein
MHLHSFKIKSRLIAFEAIPVDTPVQHTIDNLPWINFHDRQDPISSALDFYNVNENIDCRFEARKFEITHTRYWEHKQMYVDIYSRYLN